MRMKIHKWDKNTVVRGSLPFQQEMIASPYLLFLILYTTAILGQEILQLKVRKSTTKVASRKKSVYNFTLCAEVRFVHAVTAGGSVKFFASGVNFSIFTNFLKMAMLTKGICLRNSNH